MYLSPSASILTGCMICIVWSGSMLHGCPAVYHMKTDEQTNTHIQSVYMWVVHMVLVLVCVLVSCDRSFVVSVRMCFHPCSVRGEEGTWYDMGGCWCSADTLFLWPLLWWPRVDYYKNKYDTHVQRYSKWQKRQKKKRYVLQYINITNNNNNIVCMWYLHGELNLFHLLYSSSNCS